MNNIEDRIRMVTDQMFEESKAYRPQDDGEFQPVDIYQRDRKRINDVNAKSYPKGSNAIVNTAVNAVLDGMGAEGLVRAYKRAQDDVDSLKDQGERGRAELRRKQYMEENLDRKSVV